MIFAFGEKALPREQLRACIDQMTQEEQKKNDEKERIKELIKEVWAEMGLSFNQS
jgi:uncharacterized protein (UPF0335 family)